MIHTFQDDISHYRILVGEGTFHITEGIRDFFGIHVSSHLHDDASKLNVGFNVLAKKLLPTIGVFHGSNLYDECLETIDFAGLHG